MFFRDQLNDTPVLSWTIRPSIGSINNLTQILLSVFVLATFSIADVTLPKLFTDNMILQRGEDVNIWGTADPGETVKIFFRDHEYETTTSVTGKWSLTLPPYVSGGPFQMVINGKNAITLSNIMFGDVWVCSGQSNMYFRLAAAKNAYRDIDDANYDNIRLYIVDKDSNHLPKNDLASGEWLVCSPETARGFSAVGYFFGRELHESIDVPIGLIHASWGGSAIQAWMDGKTLKDFDSYREQVEEISQNSDYFLELEKKYEENGGNLLVNAIYAQDPGLNDDGTLSSDSFFQDEDWNEIPVPGYWQDTELPEHTGSVWYRKRFELPDAFKYRDLPLELGWIDDYDFTFFNGEPLGRKFYKGSERHYLIPKENIKTGVNEILVCVYNSSGKGGFWGPRRAHLKFEGDETGLKLDLEGLWQYKPGLNKFDFKAIKSNKLPQERAIPTFLFNAMISPITRYAIKGAIWYQGESNAGKAKEYESLLPAMIIGWRAAWNQGDFPFLIVQLANYGTPDEDPGQSDWAELREAQSKTLSLQNTGMAVTIDLGEEMDIHPTNKQDVGKRLVLSALKVAYDQDVVASGPTYKSMKIKRGRAYISFNHIGSGLMTTNKFGYIGEFSIAGKDKNFVWAKAYIDGDQIVVYSDEVRKPVAVRYAWSGNPTDANLYNVEGLPASPFRTDTWEE